MASFDVVLPHQGLVASTEVDSQKPHLTAPLFLSLHLRFHTHCFHFLLKLPGQIKLTGEGCRRVGERKKKRDERCSCPRTPAPIFPDPRRFIPLAWRPRIKKTPSARPFVAVLLHHAGFFRLVRCTLSRKNAV